MARVLGYWEIPPIILFVSGEVSPERDIGIAPLGYGERDLPEPFMIREAGCRWSRLSQDGGGVLRDLDKFGGNDRI
jgi:hypothetical protein